MIDLSHLTEEEQGVIMAVLRRDAELKKAEEERIRKLEQMLDSGSQLDTKLKYLTGEWFYEVKSRRHMDKIHGSEIILAAMKQRKGGLDVSHGMRNMNIRGSDIIPPPKPARCLEAHPQNFNDAKQENLNSEVRSPRMPRHNPFNRASLIVVEPPENNDDMSTSRDQESFEKEPASLLKGHPTDTSQTSGGSLTSEGSSVGFRPVPKKRTFLSRRISSQSESNHLMLDAQGGYAEIVPAPRLSLQRGSSESSNQSNPKGQDEMPQISVVSYQVSQSAQPSKALDENSHQPLCEVSQVSSNSSLEREINPPFITRERSVHNPSNNSDPKTLIQFSHPSTATHDLHNFRPATYTRSDASTDRETPLKMDEGDDWTQREHAAFNAVVLHTGSIQDSDKGNNSNVGTAMMQGELSLPQSSVDPDPPISYDLNFIDKSDQQMQKKSNQKHAFQLSTQTTSPTGDEDSIAKVLDWFNRSTDSIDRLNTDDAPNSTKSSDKHVEISQLRGEDSLRQDAGDILNDRKNETLQKKRNHFHRQTSEALEFRATDRIRNKEVTETQEEVKKDTRERILSQEFTDNDESQPPQISHLKSFWEKSNSGPKILISKSITPGDKGQKTVHLSVE